MSFFLFFFKVNVEGKKLNVCKIGLKLTAQMLLYCQDVNELVRNAFFLLLLSDDFPVSCF